MKDLKKDCLDCTKCQLGKINKDNDAIFGYGNENSEIMMIGSHNGDKEFEEGLPFQGIGGEFIDSVLKDELNLHRSDIYMTNIVKCRLKGTRPNNYELDACIKSILDKEITKVKPKLIIAIGKKVLEKLCLVKSINRHRGYLMFSIQHGCHVLPVNAPTKTLIEDADKNLSFRCDIRKIKELELNV